DREQQPPLAAAKRLAKRVGEALALVAAPGEAVGDEPDLAGAATELGERVERHDAAVEPDARVPRAQQVARLLLPGDALGERDRREHDDRLALRPGVRLVDDR